MDTPTCRRPRHAFTLVEMLMVITIIGILAGLLLVAIGSARKAARQAAIRIDIDNLNRALETYYTDVGEYPPDFVGVNDNTSITIGGVSTTVKAQARNAVVRHLRKRFPRYGIPHLTAGDQFDDFVEVVRRATTDNNQNGQGLCKGGAAEAGDGNGVDIGHMTPGQAMVFWLGGLPAFGGSNELTGFSTSPTDPMAARTVVTSRIPSLSPDLAKLIFDPTQPSLPISYGTTTAQNTLFPVAYFRPYGSPYAALADNWYLTGLSHQTTPAAIPYADSRTNNRWVNSGKFQIISAGLDGDYGTTTDNNPPSFPAGGNLSQEHMDNVTNLTESATIRDGLQQ
jgi:prepilin-type N-terminal cleavage/methylation domain-containing protein